MELYARGQPLGEIRLTGASKGVTLTSAATYTAIPANTDYLLLEGRNYSTAVVIRLLMNPWLWILATSDNLATEPADHSEVQDGTTSNTITATGFNTLSSGGGLLIGSHLPFGGVYVDMSATVNGTASVITVSLWTPNGWVDSGDTDGSASGGVSLAQDGAVTWTVPDTWVPEKIEKIYPHAANHNFYSKGVPAKGLKLYWTRWEWSAGLDSAIVNNLYPINRSSAYSEWVSGRALQTPVQRGPLGVSCLQHLTDAGTANLLVNVATKASGRF